MGRIVQLSAHVVNQIAAGEVIERPASVVKELMENSVDALATSISIDVEEGGLQLIRIVDDGEGIAADDFPLAFSNHATSKLSTAADLFRIRTMGFRGEALASIAEVSDLTLRSRPPAESLGNQMRVVAGVAEPMKEVGSPAGTSIEVRDLFCSTPVRRKFLKSAATEFGHISEIFTRIAVAFPRLRLQLRHNGRSVYDLPATDRLLERLGLFFGSELTDKLIPINNVYGDVRLWGYVGHPALSKSTRKSQHLFLNGRWIQDRSLQHALGEAYRGLLMVGRYPVCFLFLELPPDHVDVNVHPTKAEVRFRDSQELYRQLLATLRSTFLQQDLGSNLRVPTGTTATQNAARGSGSAGLTLRPVDPAARAAAQANLVAWAGQQVSNWQPVSDSATGSATTNLAMTGSAVVTTGSSSQLPGPLDPAFDPTLDSPPPGPRPSVRTTSDTVPGWQPRTVADTANTAWSSAVFPLAAHPTTADSPGTADAVTPGTVIQGAVGYGPVADGPVSHEIGSHSSGHNPAAIHANTAAAELDVFFGGNVTGTADTIINTVGDIAQQTVDNTGALALPAGARAMQIHDTYLLVETAEGLQVVDQHALHERILYEHLRKRVLAGRLEAQRLLIPEPVELTTAEAAAVREHAEVLASVGLQTNDFGGNTVLVTSQPVMLARTAPSDMLRDLAEQLLATTNGPSKRDVLDSLLHMMSCKAAVKAGQRLSPEEIDSLLSQRHLIDDAHHCPHGRPTALMLTRDDLDRQFGRLGAR